MSKTLQIAYVDVSLFAHATEDEGKVLEAARRLLPASQVEGIAFTKRSTRGHHGNPIVLFESRIKDKNVVKAVAENLASNLRVLDKEELLTNIERHFERGNLYVRLDKQAALAGSFKLAKADPVRFRLRFKKNKLEDVVEICREIGMLPG